MQRSVYNVEGMEKILVLVSISSSHQNGIEKRLVIKDV